jgi:hypothetical protein
VNKLSFCSPPDYYHVEFVSLKMQILYLNPIRLLFHVPISNFCCYDQIQIEDNNSPHPRTISLRRVVLQAGKYIAKDDYTMYNENHLDRSPKLKRRSTRHVSEVTA